MAAAAMMVSLLMKGRLTATALFSPMPCSTCIASIAVGNHMVMVSVSTAGIANPDRLSSAPASLTSAKGDTCALTPPSRSISAMANEWRSSTSVSPPSIVPTNRQSGRSASCTMWSVPGTSLTQCSARLLMTRSSDCFSKANSSSSMSRVVASMPPTLPVWHRSSMRCDESHCTSDVTPPCPASIGRMSPSAHPISAAWGSLRTVSLSLSTSRSAISCRSSE
mmetsp:Transcript_27705/g.54137  ORF Transcript_27705/g.54137 Transcript_27705/m.54137 type:complete len:222 (-) Transcript_27705:69-734(-)